MRLVHHHGGVLDDHHSVVDCFVLGDQVVMTPSFWGSEPTTVDVGIDSRHEGLPVFDEELDLAVAATRSLSGAEQAVASVSAEKSTAEGVAGAFQDDAVVPCEGAVLTDPPPPRARCWPSSSAWSAGSTRATPR